MLDWIIDGLKDFANWVVDLFVSLGDAMVNGLVSSLPSFGSTSLDTFATWLSIANQWVPIDFALLSLGSLYAFYAGLTIVRYTIKFIPTIG